MRKFSQPQNPNPMDLRVQRRHKKREGKVERDTARVFYMRLSQVRLKIQFKRLLLPLVAPQNPIKPMRLWLDGDDLPDVQLQLADVL